ncbi:amino acid adenylation protein, partial [Mycobacterium sp. ITM-2017-0098]
SEALPAALVPRLVVVDELPTRTSGKVDRDALPWPVGGAEGEDDIDLGGGTLGWLAGLWRDVLAAQIDGPEADFYDLGGGSLSAAQLVAALRQRYPQVTVADLYDHPRLGSLAGYLDELDPPPAVEIRAVAPVSRLTQAVQTALTVPLAMLTGMQWVVWLAIANNVASELSLVDWVSPINWWWVLGGFLLFVSPPGRMGIAVFGARVLIGD